MHSNAAFCHHKNCLLTPAGGVVAFAFLVFRAQRFSAPIFDRDRCRGDGRRLRRYHRRTTSRTHPKEAIPTRTTTAVCLSKRRTAARAVRSGSRKQDPTDQIQLASQNV